MSSVLGSQSFEADIRRIKIALSLPGNVVYSEQNVGVTPTKEDFTAAFGSPSAVGAGFIGIVNDNGDSTNLFLATSDGTDWWYTSMTKANPSI